MFFDRYLLCLSLIAFVFATDANPKPPILYAQDYCQHWTIDHKISVDEEHPSVIVRAHRGSYRPFRDCQLRVVNGGDNDTGLNVVINRMDLRKNVITKDYLVIKFDDKKSKVWHNKRSIDYHDKEKFFVTTHSDEPNEVIIRFITTFDNHDFKDDKGFDISVNLFKRRDKEKSESDNDIVDIGCDKKFSFDCENDICINRKLVCNGIDNCGNGSDEPENCKYHRNNNWYDFFDNGFWFGFKIVASLLLVGVLLGILSCICKTYDENKQLRKQLLIEELNRHSGYRLRNNSIYSLNQKKTPLYPQLYRTYGGTEA